VAQALILPLSSSDVVCGWFLFAFRLAVTSMLLKFLLQQHWSLSALESYSDSFKKEERLERTQEEE
jgi:hypothetical protein